MRLARRPGIVAVLVTALAALGLVGAAPSTAVTGLQPQTITLLPAPPASAHVGETYVFTAQGGGSSQPVLMHVAVSTSAICSLDPQPGPSSTFTLTYQQPGQCVLKGTQAGDATYAEAPTFRAFVDVSLKPQTVSFVPDPQPNAAVGGSSTFLATGGGSAQPVGVHIAFISNAACHLTTVPTPAGTSYTVTYDAPGQCLVKGRQEGDDTYDVGMHSAFVDVTAAPVAAPAVFLQGLTPTAGGYDVARGSSPVLVVTSTSTTRPKVRSGTGRWVRMHSAGVVDGLNTFTRPVHVGTKKHRMWVKVRVDGVVHRLLVRVHG